MNFVYVNFGILSSIHDLLYRLYLWFTSLDLHTEKFKKQKLAYKICKRKFHIYNKYTCH